MNEDLPASVQKAVLPIDTEGRKSLLFSPDFLASGILEDDEEREYLIRHEDPFTGSACLEIVSPQSFAETLGWPVPEDWKRLSDFLNDHPDRKCGMDEVAAVGFAKLNECLYVFSEQFDRDSDMERTAFLDKVYPLVNRIRTRNGFSEVAGWLDTRSDETASTLREFWQYWGWYVSLVERSGAENAKVHAGLNARKALDAMKAMFSDLFEELHPIRREIERVRRLLKQSVCPIRIGGVLRDVLPKPARRIVHEALEKITPISQATQPVKFDFNAVDAALARLAVDIRAAGDADASDFFAILQGMFHDHGEPLCLCPAFEMPSIRTVVPTARQLVTERELPPKRVLVEDLFGGMREVIEPAKPRKPRVEPPVIPSAPIVPPTLTPVELAAFKRYFITGTAVRGFCRRVDLDTFTEGAIGKSVCIDGYGMGKSLNEYFKEAIATAPADVFRLCKALLEDDEKRPDPPVPWYIKNTDAEREEKRQERKATQLQLRTIIEDAERKAANPPGPSIPPPIKAVKTPVSPTTGRETALPADAATLEEQRKQTALLQELVTGQRKGTDAVLAGNTIAERTAANTGVSAEADKGRLTAAKGILDHGNTPDLRPSVVSYLPRSWITIKLANGNLRTFNITAPKAWETIGLLIHAPGEGWVELPRGWDSNFSGNVSQDLMDFSDLVEPERTGRGGTHRFRLP